MLLGYSHSKKRKIKTKVVTTRTSKYKMLSYSGETALQGVLQFWLKVEEWNWETIFYVHYRSIFNAGRLYHSG